MKTRTLRVIGICALLLLSGYDCWGQVSLRWMRSSAARRKRLEQMQPPSSNTRYVVPAATDETGAGARLGLALDRACVRAIWAERSTFQLPVFASEQQERVSQRLLSLSAFRMAKYWHLTQQTKTVLLEESAYNYRLDFAKTPQGNVNITVTPVLNKGAGGAAVNLTFFMKPVTQWVYGLFMQGCLDTKQPNPPCTPPQQIGRLSR